MAKFVIYGRPGCQWCEKAITLLVARGKIIEYVNIRENEENMARFRKHHANATTVPQIDLVYPDMGYIRYIGGYTDLEVWFNIETGSDI